MKKLLILLGLLALALFVVSCAPKESVEGEEVVEEEKGALAGQAISANYCTDSDGGLDYKVKGTAVSKQYPKGVTDICLSSKKLAEKYCSYKKLVGSVFDCAQLLGSDYGCNNGACVTCKNTFVSAACEGSTVVSTFKDSCTNVQTEIKYDCSKKGDVCGTKDAPEGGGSYIYDTTGFYTTSSTKDIFSSTLCYTPCASGESKIDCFEQKGNTSIYHKYICNPDGLDYKYEGQINACPAGTTCQDKDQSGHGVCK